MVGGGGGKGERANRSGLGLCRARRGPPAATQSRERRPVSPPPLQHAPLLLAVFGDLALPLPRNFPKMPPKGARPPPTSGMLPASFAAGPAMGGRGGGAGGAARAGPVHANQRVLRGCTPALCPAVPACEQLPLTPPGHPRGRRRGIPPPPGTAMLPAGVWREEQELGSGSSPRGAGPSRRCSA